MKITLFVTLLSLAPVCVAATALEVFKVDHDDWIYNVPSGRLMCDDGAVLFQSGTNSYALNEVAFRRGYEPALPLVDQQHIHEHQFASVSREVAGAMGVRYSNRAQHVRARHGRCDYTQIAARRRPGAVRLMNLYSSLGRCSSTTSGPRADTPEKPVRGSRQGRRHFLTWATSRLSRYHYHYHYHCRYRRHSSSCPGSSPPTR